MPEPWDPETAEEYMAEQDPIVSAVVLAGIAQVLDEIRAAVMSPTQGIPVMGAWTGSQVWERYVLNGPLVEVVERIIGHVLALGGYRSSTQAYARRHLDTVWSRLRDWPEGAWAYVSEVLEAGIADGLDSRGLRERVGDALNVTSLTRTTEAEMERLYDRIDQGVTPAEESVIRARIRELAETADRSRRTWEWRADRIARTEVAGAVNAGVDAWASESARATGAQWWRQWRSSRDGRVRATHRVADGQIVPPGGAFQVGAASLRWPGDPLGPPQEVINCRCSTLLLTPEEAARG